jgi:hypothetical protein
MSALIPSWAEGRPSQAMHASYPAPSFDVRIQIGLGQGTIHVLVGLGSVDDFLELQDHFRAHYVDRRVVDRDTPTGGRPSGEANLCGLRKCACSCHGILPSVGLDT